MLPTIRLVAAMLLAAAPAPLLAEDWEFLGVTMGGTGPRAYIDRESVEHLGNGVYRVVEVNVFEVDQVEIGRFLSDGTLYYDPRSYRSSAHISLYDCPNELWSTARSAYYTSEWPRRDALVVDDKEDASIFLPMFSIDPVPAAICPD